MFEPMEKRRIVCKRCDNEGDTEVGFKKTEIEMHDRVGYDCLKCGATNLIKRRLTCASLTRNTTPVTVAF